MPKNGSKWHDRDQWEQPRRGVTIEDTAAVTLDRDAIKPQVMFRGGMKARYHSDFLYVGPIGSSSRTITISFGPPMLLTTGCFTGTVEDFRREVEMKPQGTQHRREYEALMRFLAEVALIRGFAVNAPASASGVPECGLGAEDNTVQAGEVR